MQVCIAPIAPHPFIRAYVHKLPFANLIISICDPIGGQSARRPSASAPTERDVEAAHNVCVRIRTRFTTRLIVTAYSRVRSRQHHVRCTPSARARDDDDGRKVICLTHHSPPLPRPQTPRSIWGARDHAKPHDLWRMMLAPIRTCLHNARHVCVCVCERVSM